MIRTVIVEGPTDQQFVGGMLAAQGWSHEDNRGTGESRVAKYRMGREELHLLYWLKPSGEQGVLFKAKAELTRAIAGGAGELVLVLDDDSDVNGQGPNREAQFRGLLGSAEWTVAPTSRTGRVGQTGVHLVVWKADIDAEVEKATPGIPKKQTLERLVCVALAQLPTGNGARVAGFLKDEPLPDHSHKHYAMAYFARHFPSGGNHEFYRFLWGVGDDKLPSVDDQSRKGLREKLTELTGRCGAWSVFEALRPAQSP